MPSGAGDVGGPGWVRGVDWNSRPFFRWMGLRILESEAGRARLELHVGEHHRGGGGTRAVNGGVVAYAFDAAMATAAASTWEESVRGQVTVHMGIDYLRMLDVDRRAELRAHVVHRGRSTIFVAAEVADEAERVCARASGIYRIFAGDARPPQPGGHRPIQGEA